MYIYIYIYIYKNVYPHISIQNVNKTYFAPYVKPSKGYLMHNSDAM